MVEPEGIYFVTARCQQARLLMRPSADVNQTIGAVLVRALKRFDDIELFAFVVASNHVHLMLRSRRQQIPAFMQYLLSNVAKRVGLLAGWSGKFWGRRYDAAPVLDDEATMGRLRYILAHGVKEGLVDRCAEWPGLSSLQELLGDEPRVFAWNEHEKVGAPLRLTTLPCWNDGPRSDRRRAVEDMLAEIEREARVTRSDQQSLSARRVLAQDPLSRPRNVSRSARPLCHATARDGRGEYEQKYVVFAAAYREASAAYRAGDLAVEFPAYAYRPPWTTALSLRLAA